MKELFLISLFLLGAILGSFLNCLIYRMHEKKSITKGFSECPKCKKRIAWYDNIPILGYLILRGRCRHCRKPISPQYILVELATALLFLVIGWSMLPQCNSSICIEDFFLYGGLDFYILFIYIVFTSILVVIFVYDLRYFLILDRVSLPSIGIAFVLNVVVFLRLGLTGSGIRMEVGKLLLAGLVVGGFFLVQFVVSKGKWIGGGDIRLGFLMGIILGWPEALIALFLAYVVGAVFGVIMLTMKKASGKTELPFGTFLAISTFVTMLWGSEIAEWYFGLF